MNLDQAPSGDKHEEIKDPQRWLEERGCRFVFSTPEEMMTFSGKDIQSHYREIEDTVPQKYRFMLKSMVDYIRSPLVIDDFPNETERNLFHKEEVYKHPSVKSLFELNRLRGNSISAVLGVADAIVDLEDWFNDKPDLIAECQALDEEYRSSDDLTGGYADMALEEKIIFTKKVASLALKLYKEIVLKNGWLAGGVHN